LNTTLLLRLRFGKAVREEGTILLDLVQRDPDIVLLASIPDHLLVQSSTDNSHMADYVTLLRVQILLEAGRRLHQEVVDGEVRTTKANLALGSLTSLGGRARVCVDWVLGARWRWT
jgi:hypothetical protein